MFNSIGDLVKSAPGRAKSTDAIFALQVRQAAKQALKNECGDLVSGVMEQIKVTTFKTGVLTIKAPSIIGGELYTRASGLKKDINRQLGRNIVRELRFKVK